MNRTRSIVKQASILAIAGILVRIIGLLYRSPLTKLITTEGIGYYSSAYEIYALILLISSYSIPTAISKLLSEKLVLNQYNNVQKILHCAFIYILAISGGAAIITFFIAPLGIVPANSVPALRVLCPTIFLSGLLGVFRGYFQAHQNTLYTSISQIIEQLFNAFVSIAAAYLFIQPYLEVGGSKLASIGAAGSAIGTGAGVLVGLIYMILIYLKRHNDLIIKNDPDPYEDSYHDIFKMILHIVTPIIIATCIYNSVSTFEMYLFYFVEGSGKKAVTLWGVYIGEFMVLRNVPVALASAMSTASIPAISSSWTIKDYKSTRANIKTGIRITMLVLIPAAAGMSALAYPIMGILFPQEETIKIATHLLQFGSISIVFFGLSTLTNGILQALGEVNIPLKNAAFALVVHCIFILALLYFTNLGLYALLIGNCLYSLHVCILNQRALRKITRFKQEIKRTYLLPLFASLIMAVCVYGCYYGLFMLTKQVFIPLIISIIVGIIIYFIIIFYLYSDHPEELSSIPYATRIMRKLHK